MKIRLRPLQYSILLVILCCLIAGGLLWYRSREATLAAQIRHMPYQEGVLVYIDVGALRSSGILGMIAGSPQVEELDYRKFVEQTGFDYREDLDSVLASFARGEVYAILRGRFNWRQLQQYARDNGGSCLNAYCSLEGSKPGRAVSFFPMRPELLAIAVGKSTAAAYMMMEARKERPVPLLPAHPLWAVIHKDTLRDSARIPDGTRALLSAAKGAREVTLALGAKDQAFEAELRMEFPSLEEAAAAEEQLRTVTEYLRKFLERANQKPKDGDLAAVLLNGRFSRSEKQVFGRWPVSWTFLRAVSEGKL